MGEKLNDRWKHDNRNYFQTLWFSIKNNRPLGVISEELGCGWGGFAWRCVPRRRVPLASPRPRPAPLFFSFSLPLFLSTLRRRGVGCRPAGRTPPQSNLRRFVGGMKSWHDVSSAPWHHSRRLLRLSQGKEGKERGWRPGN